MYKQRTLNADRLMLNADLPLGVSTYTIEETLPLELEKVLPSSKEIAEHLSLFDESEKPDDQ